MHIKNLTFNMVPNALRHPSESGHYLVVVAHEDFHNKYKVNYITTLNYSKKHDAWNVGDDDTDNHTQFTHDRILAWTPFEHIVNNLQPMVNEHNMEILKAKLAKAQAALAEITKEATHEQ